MKSSEGLSQGLLLYGYAVLLGASYILAFWRPFGFNIFPYLSTADLLVAPLNRLTVLLAPIMLVAVIQVEKRFKSSVAMPFYGFVILMLLHLFVGVVSLIKMLRAFSESEFRFANETSIVLLCVLLLFFASMMFCRSFFQRDDFYPQLLAIVLAQMQLVLSAGYVDGKGIFNGAYNVHFLEQKKLCDDRDLREWVYVERFGGSVFFMNVIDKRLCILNEVKFNLISRQYSEES